ncbi:hypothetical protein QNI19_38085 [Cytophagaceae bacterium DM2B3-1]|uniref:Uncharacterized protein n=1 Tax=Xanthocytophaga flava TaxID=3048013 RepID=A0ABT7D0V3_9BACT|nr:hypothetical protein [Xanthocytophaga flavus]MDJ1498802.1 hypothetical protein [Xanthocytophaga flavus]
MPPILYPITLPHRARHAFTARRRTRLRSGSSLLWWLANSWRFLPAHTPTAPAHTYPPQAAIPLCCMAAPNGRGFRLLPNFIFQGQRGGEASAQDLQRAQGNHQNNKIGNHRYPLQVFHFSKIRVVQEIHKHFY